MEFLRRKFYEGFAVNFAKDRHRLLTWVALWPAAWLKQRAVTVTEAEYKKIFFGVFMDALRFGDTGNITYLPAYLRRVIQSHFAMHGDEIYEGAKSVRNLTENALLMAGKLAARAEPDPVADLARAHRLLTARKRPIKQASQRQQDLL